MTWIDDIDREVWEESFEDEAIARMDLRDQLRKAISILSPQERRVLLDLVVGNDLHSDDRKILHRLRRKLVGTTFWSEKQ